MKTVHKGDFENHWHFNPAYQDAEYRYSYGNVLALAPSAAIKRGQCVVLGSVAGIADADIASGALGPVIISGVVTMTPRNASTTFTVGAKCYSANASNKINSSAANSLTTFIGFALDASPNNSSDPIRVLLSSGGA